MKRMFCLLLCLCFLCILCASGVCAVPQALTCHIAEIAKYGNLILSVPASGMLDAGYAYGDVIRVTIADRTYDMPVGSSYSDVDDGSMICRLTITDEEDVITLAVNMGDLAGEAGIAAKTAIDAEPGYRWDYAGGLDVPVKVTISMLEAGGYADEYHMRQLVRTNDRADYPRLTDAQFANFRAVDTAGMGRGMLYRSSSPVNPELGRSAFADAALAQAGVRTVINLADSEGALMEYPGFADSAYASCSVTALNLSVDVQGEEFARGFAKGLRFLIENEGPYLVHCTEGKDRAGFVSAVLECLMGAPAQAVVSDYMVTYENYYGVERGSERHARIAQSNICKTLAAVFGVEDIHAADLALEAQEYLARTLGLSEAEIEAVKACLSAQNGTEK
ncbi:MAG: tyrosine-protein phosphatase [Clostridia bacterium]|nr:tyrosine-protein phosphatase [Clostridia bacterium]